jgi:23S rRNA (adenine2030-N6)-methyltransferase
MLSYRHGYHAGNFADVFKHVILIQLIQALRHKDKPFCVVDTHAGSGRYDLQTAAARKTEEFRHGIGLLWGGNGFSPALESYLAIVRTVNEGGELRYYPGSPRIARALLRHGDRLIASELHNRDYPLLKSEFTGDRQVAVHHIDGYSAIKAFLPPRERRGLVLLDPCYERKDEFQHLLAGLALIHRRWPGGITAIWYPILERTVSLHFQKKLRDLAIPSILCAELGLYPYDIPVGMRGCGMIIVNPPWQLDKILDPLLRELLFRLQVDQRGQIRLEWLVPEKHFQPEVSP